MLVFSTNEKKLQNYLQWLDNNLLLDNIIIRKTCLFLSIDKHAHYGKENLVNALGSENECSHARTYLPSSAIKVDSPIRNLAYISGIQGNVRAVIVTTITTAIMCRYHYYSAHYFDSHARVPLSSSSHSSTRIHFASRVCILCVSKKDVSPTT